MPTSDDLQKLKIYFSDQPTEPQPDFEIQGDVPSLTVSLGDGPITKGYSLKKPTLSVLPDYIINMNVEVVVDSEHPEVGKAHYNALANKLTIYLHEGMTVNEIIKGNVYQLIEKNQNVFSVSRIVKYNINPTETRTCKWFTASKDLFGAFSLTPSDEFDYDAPTQTNSCSNPAVLKANGNLPIVACGYDQNQYSCNYYEVTKWTPIRYLESDDNQTSYLLERTRKHFGFDLYRIVQQSPNSTDSIILEVNAIDQPDACDIANEKFDAILNDGGLKELAVGLAAQDDPYFKLVMSDA